MAAPSSVDAADDPVPDAAAVAEAEAVLIGIAERSEDVSDGIDIGGGEGCPLLAGFDGLWLAEAGGALSCASTDNTMSIGASMSSTFAEALGEEGFEQVVADGPITNWCVTGLCIVSWTSGTIDVFVFQLQADDPSFAERFLLDHLVEIVDGIRTFDVDLIPAS